MSTQSGTLAINPDHIAGHDVTLRSALGLWTSRNRSVVYKTWQSVYFGVLRYPSFDNVDDEAPGSLDLGARQIRMKRFYSELE